MIRNEVIQAAEYVAQQNRGIRGTNHEDPPVMPPGIEGDDYKGEPAPEAPSEAPPPMPETGPPKIEALVLEPVAVAITSIGRFVLTDDERRQVAGIGLKAFERASRAVYRELADRYSVKRVRVMKQEKPKSKRG